MLKYAASTTEQHRHTEEIEKFIVGKQGIFTEVIEKTEKHPQNFLHILRSPNL